VEAHVPRFPPRLAETCTRGTRRPGGGKAVRR
jgi:hypothetical protein